MRKRIAVFLFALAVTTSAFAETQRYIVGTKRAFADGALRAVRDSADGVELDSRNVAGFGVVRAFAADLTPEEAAALRESGEVRFVEPVLERYAFDAARNLGGQTMPLGIHLTGARFAWAARRSGTVNVVVTDTGIDPTHPELKDAYAGAYNVFNKGDAAVDDHGHGTHVSGTIAAADNDIGVVGVTPGGVRLWAVKVLNAKGAGSSEGILHALDWVAKQKQERGGNWVVNMSLGASSASEGEREAFQKMADAGIIVVAASGNSSTANKPAPVAFPAAHPSVVAVGAIDDRRRLASFSGQGPEVDFAAPGVSVLSTVPVGSNFLAYVATSARRFAVEPLVGSAVGTVTGDYVFCGVGKPEEFPAAVRGNIALIRRGGEISFANKTRAAKAAGAVAVAIFNHDESDNPWTLLSDDKAPTEQWPIVLRLRKQDGEDLVAKGPGRITLSHVADDYAELSGTSMATPHVTGAIALLWMLAPDASAETILAALRTTAGDLGTPGPDPQFGAGAINIFEAARLLAPGAFPTGPTTGRGAGRRGR